MRGHRTIRAPGEGHVRRSYEHGTRARTLVLVYLGVVAISAVPFVGEVLRGESEGTFGFLPLLLTTLPLGLITMMLPMPNVAVLVIAVAATALVQAFLVWSLHRGPAVMSRDSSSPPPAAAANGVHHSGGRDPG
ncbi:SCO4225 family membrane protein [Ornithinimicrobium sp. W1679]|uniref:SCO4225 family membrane protein n=1 Tax=Ornithinimicrobium sp. W1679 TaxID=3418770 RepID=UPI003CF987AB